MDNGRHYDLVVIGSGPAGQHAALQAAKRGGRVCVVERRQMVGGSCLHVGTIPSKTLRESVLYLTGWRLRNIYGHSYAVKSHITMSDLLYRTNFVIERELNVIRRSFARQDVDVVAGVARFVDPHTVVVDGVDTQSTLRADHFVVATGTTAYRPPNIPFNDRTVIDSDQILELDHLPKRLTLIGAGVIGIEYASIFSTLDIDVTVVSRSSNFFGFVDREITDALTYHLRQRGVALRMNEIVSTIETGDDGSPTVILESGKRVRSDLVMVASGRAGTAHQLELDKAGVKPTDRGLLEVNAHYQTEVPHIYAASDIIGFPSLASTSMEQGRKAACHILQEEAVFRQDLFPYGIYSIPEIAYIGKNEEELTQAGIPYETGVAHYREIAKGEIHGDDIGMLKMLFHTETRKLLGVHAIGLDSTEIIHIGQAVMTYEGTLEYFIESVFNYPTLAECYKLAALDAQSKLA
ncbi:MAG: Si-specific NAD(P)(+) transhydrogenase [Myxococcota bacterium]